MSAPGSKVGHKEFAQLRKTFETLLIRMLDNSQGKMNYEVESCPLPRLFTQKETEDLVGKTGPTLRTLEDRLVKEGVIKPVEKNPETGKRVGYRHNVILELMKAAGTLPWRDAETDKPMIIAIDSFKGGTGKTETTSHCLRNFAIKGYRVLGVDFDHQGSLTSSFGYIPDLAFSKKDTVIPYIKGDEETLHYAVKKTAWPNIDLIPGCMALEDVNWALAFEAAGMDNDQDRRELYNELRAGLDTVADSYDIIIIDCPPSSSVNNFSILAAADGIVVPIPPAKHDMASTTQFLAIAETLLGGTLKDKEYDFVRFLVTKYQNEGNRSTNDLQFFSTFKGALKDYCYDRVFRLMSPIKDASAQFTTVYEMTDPNKKILRELDAVFDQIEVDILHQWPSKTTQLASVGYGV